jgi:hypothetical protein
MNEKAKPGANPTTSDFTVTTPEFFIVGKSIFQSRRKYFCFQNAQGLQFLRPKHMSGNS